jgi:hypothetical protein
MEVLIAVAKARSGQGAFFLGEQGVVTAETEGVVIVPVREIKLIRVMTDQQPVFGGSMGSVTRTAVPLGNRLMHRFPLGDRAPVTKKAESGSLFLHQATVGRVVGLVTAQTFARGYRRMDMPAGGCGCMTGHAQLPDRGCQQLFIAGSMDRMAGTAFAGRHRLMDVPVGQEAAMAG